MEDLPPVVDLSNTSFGRQKSQATKDEENELRLSNTISFQRRKKQAMLQEMIKTGSSLTKANTKVMNSEERELQKGQHPTFKSMLKSKIAKRKESNLTKINKIKIKSKKI